jgi:catechol 2,3-dioxygenase-like lactoylglutathione lyase family enzyme
MNILKPHVSLNISNIDASVTFYEKVFGVKAVKRRPGYAKFDLSEPNLNLTMQEAPRSGVNASHFGVQVASTEDVAAAWTRFKDAGLPTKTEDDTTCCYALQDKVWVEDRDGKHEGERWLPRLTSAGALRRREWGRPCSSRPSWAPASWPRSSRAGTSRSPSSQTRSRPGPGSLR